MRVRFVTLAVVLAVLGIAAPSAGAATFTVDSLGDQPDFDSDGAGTGGDNACNISSMPGGLCTLRAAIQQVNEMPGSGPHTISLSALNGSAITVGSDLPAIAVDDTIVDGCATPTPSPSGPCVGLRASTAGSGTGLEVEADDVTIRSLAISRFSIGIDVNGTGMILRNSDIGIAVNHTSVEGMERGVRVTGSGARIGGSGTAEGNVFAGNDDGLLIWGGDFAGVYGNVFGLRRLDGVVAGNDRAVVVAGRSGAGPAIDEATNNAIGGASNAVNDEGGSCGGLCNIIAGSATMASDGAGVDLAGRPAANQTPAGGTTINGNWIGLDGDGDGARNDVGIRVGDGGKLVANDTAGAMIGGPPDSNPTTSNGNLIAGNGQGINQDGGQGVLTVLSNVFGLAPDFETGVPNVTTNAILGGKAGAEVYVQFNSFGATATGLALTGPRPIVIGNLFTPVVGSYASAALEVLPGASDAMIGTNIGGCVPIPAGCNAFGGTAPGVPAIWIRGADGARISANVAGFLFAPSLPGPPVRVTDGPAGEITSGALVGSEDPALQNLLLRTTWPAVEIRDGATGVVIAGNEGRADSFGNPASIFTDLIPGAGPGNAGAANAGIQPPAVGTATTAGIAGSGTPGATIRVLQQWRADDLAAGIDGPGEGWTLPTNPAVTTVADDGTWSMGFADKVPVGQKLTASQTTASGSSEYAALTTATEAPPLPVAQITGGPIGTTTERSATFSFSTPTPGATLECAFDGGPFAPCTSPATFGPLEIGAHQFRVQARVGQSLSLPVSRTWAIEPASAPAAPSSPSGPTASSARRFNALVSMPSTRRCVSRRKLRLRLRKPTGTRIVFAEIRVTGRPLKTVSGRALSAAIDLRGLPKGRVRVRVRVVLSSGRVVSGSRTYTTCAPKKAKKKTRQR